MNGVENLGMWLGIAVILIVLSIVASMIRSRFVTAKPNEWLLVIKNGEMKSAGIGKTAFQDWNSQVVTFPSTIQRVQFKAQQVTREMQGIEVSGFVVWVIYREEEGPFKAYKHLDGLGSGAGMSLQASENIARMAESIIRHQVANSTIAEVITQRERLRDMIRAEMQAIVKGWGVWLETVEITDVIILSKNLFEDLQASFRQETRRNAEGIRLDTERAIELQKIAQHLDVSKQRAKATEEQKTYEAQQRLEREKEEAKLLEEQLRIRRETVEHEHALEQLRQVQRIELDTAEAGHRLELRRQELKLEEEVSPWGQRLEVMRSLERIYERLPIKEVKVVQMGGGQDNLLGQLLAQLKAAEKALQDDEPVP